MQRLRLRQLILCAICLSIFALYLLLAPADTSIIEVVDGSGFYKWRTNTSFSTFDGIDPAHLPLHEICSHFPKHKLDKIQPVLKTGHGVLQRVEASLRSTSACLDNLLILSDLEEKFDGHNIVDIIGDIPPRLLTADEASEQTHPYFELARLRANGTLDAATTSRAQGWAIDKFKFLPAVNRAWRDAPKKEWYVFYEGDTYIVWDTVFQLLEHFDPDKPHYFGSPAPGRDETWFAYGGSGYILSRAAVWRLVKRDWSWLGFWLGTSRLLEEYWSLLLSDCCGDSVLGWILHGQDINVEGLWPMFNPHPLHGLPFSDLYWCQPVISMHRSSHAEELDLWRWEWKERTIHPHRPVLYRDIATSFFDIASFTTVRHDWDNSEWDAYEPTEDDTSDSHASSKACDNACRTNANCFQWTYHLRRCRFVKAIMAGRTKQPGIEKEFENGTWTREDQRYVSGWHTTKIQRWIDDRPCTEVQWVIPSIERIF